MIYSNLDRLFMLSKKCHTLISPAPWLAFNILSVMSRSHFFSHDPFLPLRSWFIGTPLDTTRLHPFIHDLFTFFQLRSVHTHSVTIRFLLLVTTRLHFFVTTHLQSFGHDHLHPLVTTRLQFFGHDPFATSRSRSIRNFSVTTICNLSNMTICTPFDHNSFARFRS